VEVREDPEKAFEGQAFETPWDKFHVAYFASEALWTYLTLPFLYTYPGFECEEIEPWHEGGEEWRRLKVAFPGRCAAPPTRGVDVRRSNSPTVHHARLGHHRGMKTAGLGLLGSRQRPFSPQYRISA